jgi:hypothetical protein
MLNGHFLVGCQNKMNHFFNYLKRLLVNAFRISVAKSEFIQSNNWPFYGEIKWFLYVLNKRKLI